jgi:hypothetical protein
MLDHVAIDWVWLRDHINRIIDEVNGNKPVGSSTIAVDESPTGSLLRVIGGQQTDSPIPSGEVWPSEVGWQPMTVIDNSSGKCVSKYIYYWGTAPSASVGPPPAMPQ